MIICSHCQSTECPCVEEDNYPSTNEDLEQDKADFLLSVQEDEEWESLNQ